MLQVSGYYSRNLRCDADVQMMMGPCPMARTMIWTAKSLMFLLFAVLGKSLNGQASKDEWDGVDASLGPDCG